MRRWPGSPWHCLGRRLRVDLPLVVHLQEAVESAEARILPAMAFVTSSPVIWGVAAVPIVLSLPYMAMIAVIVYELSRDLLRASELVVTFKEQSTDFGPLRPPDCGAGIRTDPNRPRSSR